MYPEDVYDPLMDPGVPAFAQLDGHILCFRL